MRKLLLLLFPVLAFGQMTPNSVTVTATRTAALQPDQIVFGVNVTTPIDATREDALAALQGSGITAADFSGVNATYVSQAKTQQTVLVWYFNLAAPLSNMKSTIGLLSAVQTNLAKSGKEISISFSPQGTQISPQLAQSKPCVWADLIADAKVQAQKLAGGAGLGVGAILAVSSNTSSTSAGGAGSAFGQVLPADPGVCTLTVKFALVGF